MEQALEYYEALLVTHKAPDDVIAFLGRYDRFFLLTHLCNRVDAIHPWLYDRCREVEKQTDDCLDLWARDHYKSTIVTYMGIVQEIINDPDITVGIFSHSRPIAKAFMLQIMRELEFNETLKRIFADALWSDPRKESPVWSQDSGIVVRRKTNPKESTVEAWGLVDGQPISKHFRLLVFDDVVTMASVNTPDQIRKTTEAWELAQNLGSSSNPRSWHVGTRYSFADTYGQLLERGALKERLYPATHDGTPDGEPVFLSKKVWEKKKKESSAHTIACLAAGTRIMLSDWTQKPIEEITVGDEVVGIEYGESGKSGKRTKLCKTTIMATGHRQAPIFKYTFESGKSIFSTEDHQWWSGRPLNDKNHNQYNILKLKSNKLARVCRVVDPDSGLNLTPEQQKTAYWLGGMFDGEGSTSGNSGSSYVHITQCPNHNPLVSQALRDAYTELDFDWAEYKRKDGKSASIFRYRGGRRENFRFLQMCDPVKRFKIARTMYGSRIGYQNKEGRDNLVSIEPVGEDMVYSLTTGTGNYIAEGCVSKNCQQLLNPLAGSQQEFDPEWMRPYEVRPKTLNLYILVDYAGSRTTGSSRTAFACIGVDRNFNKYLLDGAAHKMNLDDRWLLLKRMRNKWLNQPGIQSISVGYERYGAQSDIQHFEAMMRIEGNAFPIEEVNWPRQGEVDKDNRIRRLIPDHKNWRFFYPYKGDETAKQRDMRERDQKYLIAKPIKQKDENGQVYDVVEYLRDNEFRFFPATTNKDLMDAMSRVYDMDIEPPMIYDQSQLYPEVAE